jgi:hypothetical protein
MLFLFCAAMLVCVVLAAAAGAAGEGIPRTHLKILGGLVPSSPDDEVTRRRVFVTATLPRWLERCGEECRRRWYSTIGRSLGLGAS